MKVTRERLAFARVAFMSVSLPLHLALWGLPQSAVCGVYHASCHPSPGTRLFPVQGFRGRVAVINLAGASKLRFQGVTLQSFFVLSFLHGDRRPPLDSSTSPLLDWGRVPAVSVSSGAFWPTDGGRLIQSIWKNGNAKTCNFVFCIAVELCAQ